MEKQPKPFNEQQLLQSLDQYFHSPTNPVLSPAVTALLEEGTLKLKYLYPYINAGYNSSTACKGLYELFGKGEQLTRSILEHQERKMLVNRWLGLGGALGQWLFSNDKEAGNKLEEQCVGQVIGRIGTIKDEDDQLFILNKIIALGHVNQLMDVQLHDLLLKHAAHLLKPKHIGRALFQEEHFATLKKFIEVSSEWVVGLVNAGQIKPGQAELFEKNVLITQELKVQAWEELLVWWTEGNDEYLPKSQIRFRANLLCLLMKAVDAREYTCQVSLGIERRLLIDSSRKNMAELVWKHLSDLLELDGPSHNGKLYENEAPQVKQEVPEETKVEEKIHTNQERQEEFEYQEQEMEEKKEEGLRAPRNLYDCLLGLRNPVRRQLAIQILPGIIRRNPEDLIFSWQELIQELTHDMTEYNITPLIAMFVTRPVPFIDSISATFFDKDYSLNDQTLMITVLDQGIKQLSNPPPKKVEVEDISTDFYFKKLSSKYFTEDRKPEKKEPSNTRRWGHTLRAYEEKLHPEKMSLNIVAKNQPYINRFYEVANHLFFALICKLITFSPFLREPLLTNNVLSLLATLCENLKNHINKYQILSEVSDMCFSVIISMEQEQQRERRKQKKKYAVKQCKKSLLQVFIKLCLVIDEHIPTLMFKTLEQCISKLKKIDDYGIRPIVQMIEANFYSKAINPKSFDLSELS